jgi:hypothetical protein
MSSGLFANPVKNIDGSTPGIEQGTFANRPAAGLYPGAWYLSLDTKILYEWDGVGWNIALNGAGGGVTASWNDVMTNGTVSDYNAIINNGTFDSVVNIGDVLGLGGGAWLITDPGHASPPDISTGNGIFAYVIPGGGESSTTIGFYDYAGLSAETTYILPRKNTQRVRIWLPDKTGNVVIGNCGTYTAAATAGQTVITIPHDMWPLPDSGILPTTSTIAAKNAATANVLLGGYYMTYDPTNIYINLLVPVVGTPSMSIGWQSIV